MMKKGVFLIAIASLLVACKREPVGPAPELELWYDAPAAIWEESLPLGNGRLGAMPTGGVYSENIVLNDITMFSGSFDSTQFNPQAKQYLPRIQKLLLEGKNQQAQELVRKHFVCGGKGSATGAKGPFGSYQLLGNLRLTYHLGDDSVEHYRRGLVLDDAVAYTCFRMGDVCYRREYFVSQVNDVVVIKLTADKKHKICFDVTLNRPRQGVTYVDGDVVCMEGMLSSGQRGVDGVRYRSKLKVVQHGGELKENKKHLSVCGADEAYLFVSSATSMCDAEFENSVENLLQTASALPYDNLKRTHIEAYQQKFKRVSFSLGANNNSLPTDKRLENFQHDDDPSLVALYYQYGRYLLISGTREGSLPLNLQGLWANTINTPWNGDYHLNINLQMNYWPVEVANLAELHTTLIDFTTRLAEKGETTANCFYDADGWVAHVVSNPWLFTAPGQNPLWGASLTGGAWLCGHLWQHYQFSCDRQYLAQVYPVMRGATEFFLSSMIEECDSGWLVTAPSISPENSYYLPKSRVPLQVCMGPTMDMQIVNELLANTRAAAIILNEDSALVATIDSVLPRLAPMQISRKGYIQEWLKDYDEVEVTHRHVSHLYGLYPGNTISVYRTPELAEAAKVTLNRRGDEQTGWSRAWKLNLWARLHDGDRAYTLLKQLLRPAINGKQVHGGTYPNLLCSHPPYQFDGNMGGIAGVAEMIVQSHEDFIEVLPAVPSVWKQGCVQGLRVRHGATIDVAWDTTSLVVCIESNIRDNQIKIRIPQGYRRCTSHKGGVTIPIDCSRSVIELPMGKGEKVIFKCEK